MKGKPNQATRGLDLGQMVQTQQEQEETKDGFEFVLEEPNIGRIMIEVALEAQRKEGNAGTATERMTGYRLGKIDAAATFGLTQEERNQAESAKNEIRYLQHYSDRHHAAHGRYMSDYA